MWKIVTMNCIYEQDSLLPVCAVPPARQPFVRPSYRHLAQVLQEDGFSISEALPGDDQPPAVQALYAQAAAFLAQGAHA